MKKYILLLLMLVMLLVCCEKHEDDIIETEGRIALKEEKESNILRFKSTVELNDFISELKEKKVDLLEEAKNYYNKNGYTPLLLVYNLVYEDEFKEIYEGDIANVAANDLKLLFLLNENGEIGIEDKIYRIDGDFVYSYISGDQGDVANISTNDPLLLLLLNENGEIGIEDKIYRIDGDFVYTYTSGDQDSDENIDEFLEKYQMGQVRISRGEAIETKNGLTVYMYKGNVDVNNFFKYIDGE